MLKTKHLLLVTVLIALPLLVGCGLRRALRPAPTRATGSVGLASPTPLRPDNVNTPVPDAPSLPQPTPTSLALTPTASPVPTSPPATPTPLPPRDLGQIRVSEEACRGRTVLPNTRCVRVAVECSGLATIEGEVFISDPPPGVSLLGVVLIGSGGGGDGRFESANYGSAAMQTLLQQGYRLVQREWDTSWEAGSEGMLASACRYATLLTWVHDTLGQTGAMCAYGNSGGASEIGYALAHYGRDQILDFALLSNGPTMSRLDLGCLGASDASWQQQCTSLVAAGNQCGRSNLPALTCTFNNRHSNALDHIDSAYTPQTPCRSQDPAGRELLYLDSIVSPLGNYNYPNTNVLFLSSSNDCTEAAPLGMLYAQAIQSQRQIQYVPQAQHEILEYNTGANAVVEGVIAGCRQP